MQDQLDRMPDAMGVRRQTVEYPFGTLKAWMGATHFLTRTLDKVRTEMSLHVLVYNLKRMITIFGVGPLIWRRSGPDRLVQAARVSRSIRHANCLAGKHGPSAGSSRAFLTVSGSKSGSRRPTLIVRCALVNGSARAAEHDG